MKDLIAAIVFVFVALATFVFSGSAHSQLAYDMRFQQRNATNTGDNVRFIAFPPGGADGLFWYQGSTTLPAVLTLGTGLSITSGVLNASTGTQADWNASSGPAQILNRPTLATVAISGNYGDLTSAPTVVSAFTNDANYITTSGARSAISLTTTGTSGAATYSSATGVLNVPNYATSSGTVTSVAAGAGLSGGTITTSGTISMPNTGTAGTYSGVTTDAQGRVSAGTTRNFGYAARTLNTCFQVSTTRDALVSYSVDIQTQMSLTTGQQGTVYLEIFSNSSCTTGTQEIARFVNGQTGTLTIGLALTQNVTGTLTGVIPGGAYVQLRTQNNTSTPTFTFRNSQEVLL